MSVFFLSNLMNAVCLFVFIFTFLFSISFYFPIQSITVWSHPKRTSMPFVSSSGSASVVSAWNAEKKSSPSARRRVSLVGEGENDWRDMSACALAAWLNLNCMRLASAVQPFFQFSNSRVLFSGSGSVIPALRCLSPPVVSQGQPDAAPFGC